MARTKSNARRSGSLAPYHAKRRFRETPEPRGRVAHSARNIYMIQKHAATRLHYDFRLELDGVLKSWAITKGPSLDPAVKRLAVRTEDHPIEYATFEGSIPKGNYGAGTVLLWDRGSWEPLGDPHEGLKRGKIAFNLIGERLHGRWALVRMRGKDGEKRENWLLIKERDGEADPGRDILTEETTSVASGREMDDIAATPDAVWTGKPGDPAPKKAKRVKRAKLPAFAEPMKATLVDDIPNGDDWIFEMKFDGYRALAAASGGTVRIQTRNGLDWTAKFPGIARAIARLDLNGALLDGEVVAVDAAGRSDFGALQGAMQGDDTMLSYFVFDLLEEGGRSLRRKPLTRRKERLRQLLGEVGRKGPVFFVDHVEHNGAAMLASLCDKGFEGVIGKRADSTYTPGKRTKSWVKIKCGHVQEFVIVGWSKSDKDRPFASIVLAVHEDGGLRYAGRVGSGFTQKSLAALAKRFKPVAKPPVDDTLARAVTRDITWVKPELVAQVEFAEFTKDGIVRQGRFKGLREDKPARKVRREKPKPVEQVE